MRSQRRRDLLKVLQEGRASNQAEIVSALRSAGHDVTQATVSRDLRELGAMKLRSGDDFVYRLPDDAPRGMNGDLVARNLRSTLDEFVIEISAAASLVVLQTAPGHAPAVARAVDLAGLEEVVGTVAGDDTIFVATSSNEAARRIADAWLGRTSYAEEQA